MIASVLATTNLLADESEGEGRCQRKDRDLCKDLTDRYCYFWIDGEDLCAIYNQGFINDEDNWNDEGEFIPN